MDSDISDMLRRLDHYTRLRAADLRDTPRLRRGLWSHVFRGVRRFWKCYVTRRGYREGNWGVLIALMAALTPGCRNCGRGWSRAAALRMLPQNVRWEGRRLIGWWLLNREVMRWTAAGHRPCLWWRDDDAVDDTPELQRLLSVAATFNLPLLLAVIPGDAVESGQRLGRLGAALTKHPATCVAQHGASHSDRRRPGEPGPNPRLGRCRRCIENYCIGPCPYVGAAKPAACFCPAMECREPHPCRRSEAGAALLRGWLRPWACCGRHPALA